MRTAEAFEFLVKKMPDKLANETKKTQINFVAVSFDLFRKASPCACLPRHNYLIEPHANLEIFFCSLIFSYIDLSDQHLRSTSWKRDMSSLATIIITNSYVKTSNAALINRLRSRVTCVIEMLGEVLQNIKHLACIGCVFRSYGNEKFTRRLDSKSSGLAKSASRVIN